MTSKQHPPIGDIREALDVLNCHDSRIIKIASLPESIGTNSNNLLCFRSLEYAVTGRTRQKILNYLLRNWDELLAQPESLYRTDHLRRKDDRALPRRG